MSKRKSVLPSGHRGLSKRAKPESYRDLTLDRLVWSGLGPIVSKKPRPKKAIRAWAAAVLAGMPTS